MWSNDQPFFLQSTHDIAYRRRANIQARILSEFLWADGLSIIDVTRHQLFEQDGCAFIEDEWFIQCDKFW